MAIKLEYIISFDLVAATQSNTFVLNQVKITDSSPFAVGDIEARINGGSWDLMTFDPSGWILPGTYNPPVGPLTIEIRDTDDPGTIYQIYNGEIVDIFNVTACITTVLTATFYLQGANLQFQIENDGKSVLWDASINGGTYEDFNTLGTSFLTKPIATLLQNPTTAILRANENCIVGSHDFLLRPQAAPQGNVLKFSRYNGLKFTTDNANFLDNTPFCSSNYYAYNGVYRQKYIKSDVVPVQYRTNITNILIELIDINDNVLDTFTPAQVHNDGSLAYFEFNVVFDNAVEITRVRVTATGNQTIIALSEWIIISSEWKQCNLISWAYTKKAIKNKTYFASGFNPFVRVESTFGILQRPRVENGFNRGCNDGLKTVYSTPIRESKMLLYQLPGYMLESLQWGLTLNKVEVNGTEYATEQGLEVADFAPRYALANGVILFQEKGFANKPSAPVIAPPPPPESLLIIDADDGLLEISESDDKLIIDE
jgi:hypothetical protein